ncbi:hypothetical protein PO909_017793, partial [Leuciscus waleckii]
FISVVNNLQLQLEGAESVVNALNTHVQIICNRSVTVFNTMMCKCMNKSLTTLSASSNLNYSSLVNVLRIIRMMCNTFTN